MDEGFLTMEVRNSIPKKLAFTKSKFLDSANFLLVDNLIVNIFINTFTITTVTTNSST